MTAPKTSRPAAARRPQDHLEKEQPKGRDKPFRFTGPDGKTYSIPAVESILTGGFVRKNRQYSIPEQFFIMFETLLDEDSPELAALDAMNLDQVEQVQIAFGEHIGIEVGKSPASATS